MFTKNQVGTQEKFSRLIMHVPKNLSIDLYFDWFHLIFLIHALLILLIILFKLMIFMNCSNSLEKLDWHHPIQFDYICVSIQQGSWIEACKNWGCTNYYLLYFTKINWTMDSKCLENYQWNCWLWFPMGSI